MSKEKKNRNKRLLKAVEKHGIRETARRFKLSPATVHEIYWRMRRKNEKFDIEFAKGE